jgi:hypothetical protein
MAGGPDVTGGDDPAVFGDDDPEDAWHPDDPIVDLVANLIRRRRRAALVRDLEDVRSVMFDEDLAHVLERVAQLERGS